MWQSDGLNGLAGWNGSNAKPKPDTFRRVKAFTMEDRISPAYTYNFKLILGYLQVATALLSGLVDIPWPTHFTTFIHYFDFINLDFVPWGSVECVATLTFYDKLMLYAFLPPCVIGVLAAIPYLILVVQDHINRMSDSVTLRIQNKLRRRKVIKLVVFAVFLLYPTISQRILSFFVCREVEGVSYLSADFHLRCDSDEYKRYVPLAVICVLVYPVGIPFGVLTILYRNRNRMKIPSVQLAYGLLFEAYQRQFWYFEIVDLLAKVGRV